MRTKKFLGIALIVWMGVVVFLIILKGFLSYFEHAFTEDTTDNYMSYDYSVQKPQMDKKIDDEFQNEYTDSMDKVSENESMELETEENNNIYAGKTKLFDVPDIVGSWGTMFDKWSSVNDNYGNAHDNCFLVSTRDDYFVVCALDGKYSTIEFPSIFLTEGSKNSSDGISLEFYVYDVETENKELLCVSPPLKRGLSPTSFQVDVTGVKCLLIKRTDHSTYDNDTLAIDEPWIY